MSLNKQVFTDVGLTMLGQADAGATLTIARIVLGDGAAAGDSDLFPLTALIDWKADVTITRKTDMGNGTMIVSGTINEWEMPAGAPFQLRELGIMAHTTTGGGGTLGGPPPAEGSFLPPPGDIGGPPSIGTPPSDTGGGIGTPPPKTPVPAPKTPVPEPLTTTDQLYCVSNVYSDAPDTVTPGGTASRSFDITVTIDRASSVTVIIGGAGTYDAQNIPSDPTVGPGWYAGREGNVFDFKRAVQGTGISLTDSTDRITIALATLPPDFVDLYVPPSHPLCPDPAHGFTTIQLAHDYLAQFRIPASMTARIHVYKGIFDTAVPIVFSHPDSRQISLLGELRVDKTLSQVLFVDSTHKKVTVAGVTTDLVVGQRVWLANTDKGGWAGGCKVTAIVGAAVTCDVWKRDTGLADWTTTGVSGRLSYLPTQIGLTTAPAAGGSVISFPNGIGKIQNILVVGPLVPGSTYGINISDGIVQDCNVWGCARGINGGAGAVGLIGENVVTDCTFGLISLGPLTAIDIGATTASRTYINSCTNGIQPGAGGCAIAQFQTGMANCICYVVHCVTGVEVDAAFFTGGAMWFSRCNSCMRSIGGQVKMNLGTQATGASALEQVSGQTDLYAQGMGYIEWNKHGGVTPLCDPGAEAAGNQNAYIHLGP